MTWQPEPLAVQRASEYRASNLDVLRIEDGLIVEVTTFGRDLFPVFELPLTLG